MNHEIIKSKTIKVSAQRHLVIPKEYYEALQIGEEVTIELHEGQLVIKPIVKVSEDFAENLLEKLIEAGYSGEELVAKFKEVKKMVLNGEQPHL
ncbi:AbrB/MazE/SpoVT family DNA-binding domain-containing protein [Solibacillus sp. FSL K6-1126]|uniref:AbrB/MazE/SpoVT family DNA-binding domain-containing protein n=1 Tax=Solibacillus sp. FSL K6-1126 TaxID=2921463 RepID=UPI0030F6B903